MFRVSRFLQILYLMDGYVFNSIKMNIKYRTTGCLSILNKQEEDFGKETYYVEINLV